MVLKKCPLFVLNVGFTTPNFVDPLYSIRNGAWECIVARNSVRNGTWGCIILPMAPLWRQKIWPDRSINPPLVRGQNREKGGGVY